MKTRNSKLTDFDELKESVVHHARCTKEKPKPFEVKEDKDSMLHMFFD